jgi:hypothetical protein
MGLFDGFVGDIVGGIVGYKGVEDTNRANERIASARNKFEAEEALKARDFSAAEAEKSRFFNQAQAGQQRNWATGEGIRNRRFQEEQAKLQMGFQERMSSTAVQRRMLDMKKAGINPILAGKYDASSPVGAMGSGGIPSGNAASVGIPGTAKANAYGYTAQNKMQALIDNLTVFSALKKMKGEADKAHADARLSENKADMTETPGAVGKDAESLYQKGKKFLMRDLPEWVSSEAKSYKHVKDDVAKAYGILENKYQGMTEQLNMEMDRISKSKEKHREYHKNRTRESNIFWLRN